MLSIPAMSDNTERVFSSYKLTITDRRNRLSIEVIEQLECLKSWMGLENWCDPPINVDMLLFLCLSFDYYLLFIDFYSGFNDGFYLCHLNDTVESYSGHVIRLVFYAR